MTTMFDTFNQRIQSFVSEAKNRRLLLGTGSYSTPFRGTLFGCSDSLGVAKHLATERVDILWLGANPNVDRSVRKIMANDTKDTDEFDSFLRQAHSGRYAEQVWDKAGLPSVGWDPIGKPVGSWSVYAELLGKVGRPDRIAMANVIPWGSSVAKDFWKPLGQIDAELLDRLLRFSDELNTEITLALRPKLIIVPKSLGESPETRRMGIAAGRARNLKAHTIKLSRTSFQFAVGKVERGGQPWTVAYLPHPSALRLEKEDRVTIVEQARAVLSAAIAG